jgi:hypothetical protein
VAKISKKFLTGWFYFQIFLKRLSNTYNLDHQNVEILTNSIKDYRGTLLVISHDEVFLEILNIFCHSMGI